MRARFFQICVWDDNFDPNSDNDDPISILLVEGINRAAEVLGSLVDDGHACLMFEVAEASLPGRLH